MSAAAVDPIASQCLTNEWIRHPKRTESMKRAANGMFATMSIPLAAGASASISGEVATGSRPLKRSYKRAYALGSEHLVSGSGGRALCGIWCEGVKPERPAEPCGWCALVAGQRRIMNAEKGTKSAKIRVSAKVFW